MPPLGGHGVGDVVDVERLGRECHDGNERAADDFEIVGQCRILPYSVDDLLSYADDGMACFDIAVFSHIHHADPASGNQGARP